jgi:hypothetical protein
MTTWHERLAAFTTNGEPQSGCEVELLCQDHVGTYVLPFPCHRVASGWLNAGTGEELRIEILGWRKWTGGRSAGRPRKVRHAQGAAPVDLDARTEE